MCADTSLVDFFNRCDVIISVKNTTGRYIFANRLFESHFKLAPGTARGKLPNDIFPAALASQICDHDRQVLDSGTIMQLEFDSLDSEPPLTLYVTKLPMFDIERNIVGLFSYASPVNVLEHNQLQLQQHREELTQAQEIASIGNWRWSVSENRLISCSPEYAHIHGVDLDAVTELLDQQMERVIHPDDRERVDREFKRFDETGEPFEIEYRIVRPDGEVRHLKELGKPVHDPEGRITEQFGTVQDISALKRTEEALRDAYADMEQRVQNRTRELQQANRELQHQIARQELAERERLRLESQLRQSQKMEALGHLTGGVAHDFNNILASILGFGELMQHQGGLGEKQARYLDQIRLAGERGRDLVAQMLLFSRGAMEDVSTVVVADVVDETVGLLRPILPASIDIDISAMDTALMVDADTNQLQQVIMNLVINARDAMQGKGRISIELALAELTETVCNACHKRFSRSHVVLKIRDSGTGAPDETIERMFEPFYTTKEVGSGSGMGLATAHGIVHKHKGHIVAANEIGGGLGISVFLPPASLGPGVGEVETSMETPRQADVDLDILVVDDDPAVGEFIAEFVSMSGYRVICKSTAESALDYLNSGEDKIDVLITDQTMPGMTGDRLVTEVRRFAPGLPAIICSGYARQDLEETIASIGDCLFLKKPFTGSALLETLAKITPPAE